MSIDTFYRVLKPGALLRAAFTAPFRRILGFRRLPACFGKTGRIPGYGRSSVHLNRMLESLPDRLSSLRWRERCRISGLETVQKAMKEGRPVVLAFCHFGPHNLLRVWLRAAGVPVSLLVRGTSPRGPEAPGATDPLSPFPGVQTVYYRNQLREMIGSLRAGNPVLAALDTSAGNSVRVPAGEGGEFKMATGAIRLAMRNKALLIPCVIVDEGNWRFRIELGAPVPPELLNAAGDHAAAGAHLIRTMTPWIRRYAEQCPRPFLGLFRKSAAVPHSEVIGGEPVKN